MARKKATRIRAIRVSSSVSCLFERGAPRGVSREVIIMRKLFLALLLLLLLPACTAELAEPAAEYLPTATLTPTIQPTFTPYHTLTPAPTVTIDPAASSTPITDIVLTDPAPPRPTQTRTPFMTDYAAAEAIQPPAGLLYVDPEGQTFLVDDQGVSQPVGDPGDEISRDGRYKVDGLTVTELATGQQSLLYDGYGLLRYWWLENPDWVILAAFPDELFGCYGPCGTPVLARLDGSETIVLSELTYERQLTSPVAMHPQGEALAFTINEEAYLYDLATGMQALDLAASELPAGSRLGHPSYSPDGDRIAWAAHVPTSDDAAESRSGILITSAGGDYLNFLAGYQMGGWDGGFYPPTWSADGGWLAFQADSGAPTAVWGTYVAQPEAERAAFVKMGYYPTFVAGWLVVQNFELAPFGFLALSTNGVTWVQLAPIERAMSAPLAAPDDQSFLLADKSGNIWQIDGRSLAATRLDLPAGSRPLSWGIAAQ